MTTKHTPTHLSREDHIQHLKNRYEECLKAGDKNMAGMFRQKIFNMEKRK